MTLVFLLVTLAASPAWATEGTLRRSGLSEALLGRWERALARLQGEDRASQYYRAVALLNLGRRSEAFATLRSLSLSPGAFSGPALEVATDTLFGEGAYAEVLAWAAASRADQFQDASALWYHIGQSRYLTGDLDGAAADLEEVEAGRYRPYALHTLALIHFARGRLREALETLGGAVDACAQHPNPNARRALADRLHLTRARVMYQAAVGLTELDEVSRQRLVVLAREEFGLVATDGLDYPAALRGIGWASAELGEAAKALGAFDAAAARDPARRHEDLWAQGRVYQRLGFYDEAARVYAEARQAATAAAEAGVAAVPPPEARKWEALREFDAATGRRVDELATVATEIGNALAARDARLVWIGERVGVLRDAAASREGELGEMSLGLKDYMDRIPALALFPREERPRLEGLAARQDRLGLEIARAEAAFGGLGGSALWRDAPDDLRQRGRQLWARLEAAGLRLAEAQLGFLETIKRRGSKREEELGAQLRDLRAQAEQLADPAIAMESRLAAAEARQVARAQRLQALRGRLAAVLARLAEVKTGVAVGLDRTKTEAGAAEAAAYRLRADAMALDETQALHLWGEGRRDEVRP